ncbi:MAG: ammonia-forming cytochrome c nitrite reductase subunit c552 [Anaerolineae bacterium]|nr:ammonia-forming cytochrome c nitrite reductase subunit c552 [Anaerolineae bacterium]
MQNNFLHRNRIWGLVVLGLCLLVVGGYMLGADIALAGPNRQGDPPPNLGAGYRGSEYCALCHTQDDTWHLTAHAQMVQPPGENTILGDFSDEESLTITWPDGSERPITADDITYVLGGRYMQRYVSVIARDDSTVGYFVLPVQWNIPQQDDQAGVWTPYHAEDWQNPLRDWRVACAGCHTTGLDGTAANTETQFAFMDDYQEGDVELGIGCESCHGPGGNHMADAGTLVSSPDAQICGQCHIQGQDPTGEHGYPVGYQPGLALDESVFWIAPLDDLNAWWPTGHARTYNQYAEWLRSGHATSLDTLSESDMSSVECLVCHAVHDGENGTTVSYGITCVACHSPHPADTLPGADGTVAMTTGDTYALCVSCHNSSDSNGALMKVGDTVHHPVQEMFEGKTVVSTVEGMPSGHFSEDGPECTTCHMTGTVIMGEYGYTGTHTMQPTLCDELNECSPDSCTECHDVNRDYLREFVLETQNDVSERLRAARNALGLRQDAPEWIKTALDFIANDGSLGIHNFAYTDALLHATEIELNLVALDVTSTTPALLMMESPETCAECHRDEFQKWQTSPHATASLNDAFLQYFADQGRPDYCMSCHASGYDQVSGEYEFEGVVCSNCHIEVKGATHPPAPIEVADDPEDCGRCHSGAHAPTYDEWLVSAHKQVGVDCVDCHTPHDNGLLLGDVNATCGDCHEHALMDPVHMGEDMDCTDCHMARHVTQNGSRTLVTGHSMNIDPGTCAECHGDTHMLSVRETNQLSEGEMSQIAELEDEVARLEDKTDDERNSGIIGGALSALIVGFVILLVLRFRRVLWRGGD